MRDATPHCVHDWVMGYGPTHCRLCGMTAAEFHRNDEPTEDYWRGFQAGVDFEADKHD